MEKEDYEVCGIVSFGSIECGSRDDRPGVYTRVDQYLDWINKNVRTEKSIEDVEFESNILVQTSTTNQSTTTSTPITTTSTPITTTSTPITTTNSGMRLKPWFMAKFLNIHNESYLEAYFCYT